MISGCSSESVQEVAQRPKKVPSKTARRRRTGLGMVKAAIKALKEAGGSTPQSICKYIGSKFDVPKEPEKLCLLVKKALKEGVEKQAIAKPPTSLNRYKINMSVERRRRRRGGKKGKGKKGKGRRRRRGRKGKGKGKKGKGRRRRRRRGGKKGKK